MQDKLFHAQNGVFGTCLILSLAALGLSSHWISASLPFFYNFEGLGLVASILSVITLSTFLGVGAFRKNAVITMIGVQLCVLIVLSVLFLVEGVISNDTIQLNYPFGCNDAFFTSLQIKFCNELVSLKGISFAIFAIMLAYWLPLLIMVVIELTHGRNTLKCDIREVSFSLHTQAQANAIANGLMKEMGITQPSENATQKQQDISQQRQQNQERIQQQIQLQQNQENIQQQIQLQQNQQEHVHHHHQQHIQHHHQEHVHQQIQLQQMQLPQPQ